MTINCDIYRSGKKPDMYLYVKQGTDLETLPPALLKQFGRAELALQLALTPERRLARANTEQVLKSLDEQGFYLQLPPQADAYMQSVNQLNDKLAQR